jgi:hypothetical protein
VLVVAIGSVCLGEVDSTGVTASDVGTACMIILCLFETRPLLKNCWCTPFCCSSATLFAVSGELLPKPDSTSAYVDKCTRL